MKKIKQNDQIPRHEAIVALKQIAIDRQDPYLMDRLQQWIETYVLQVGTESRESKEFIALARDKAVDLRDHITKRNLVQLGTGAANAVAEKFDMSDDAYFIERYRMLVLRPKMEDKQSG